MATKTDTKYIETIGRRKTASARVRLTPGTRTSVTVNGKDVNVYFTTDKLRMIAVEAFLKAALTTQFAVTATVVGGGINGQAEAVRHAISRIGRVRYQPPRSTQEGGLPQARPSCQRAP